MSYRYRAGRYLEDELARLHYDNFKAIGHLGIGNMLNKFNQGYESTRQIGNCLNCGASSLIGSSNTCSYCGSRN